MKKLCILFAILLFAGFGCAKKSVNPETGRPITDEKTVQKQINKKDVCDTLHDGSIDLAEAYKQLPTIGQIFTASHCGDDAVEQLSFVQDGQYVGGLTIWLPHVADNELTELFKKGGFVCSGENEYTCKKWRLSEDKTVPVETLLEMRQYAPQMALDECLECEE